MTTTDGASSRSWTPRWSRILLGLALSAIFLVLAVKDVPINDVLAALRQADPIYLVLALAAWVAANLAKAARWQAILRPQAPQTTVRRLFAVLMISQAMNAFAPVRVGDIARAYMVPGVSVGVALYSVVIEKALDSLALLATLAGVAALMPLPGWLKQSGIAFSLALVVVLALLALAGRGGPRVVATAASIERRFALARRLDLSRRAGRAAEVMRALGQGRLLATTLAWTIVSWLLGVAINVLVFAAMGLQLSSPLVAATFLIVVLYLGAIVPASPGKVGVFHYLVVVSLALFAVDKTSALAYAVVLHLVVYGPIAVLGAWYVWRASQQRGRP